MPDTEMPHSRMRRPRLHGLRQVIGWGFSAAFALGVLAVVSQRETVGVRFDLPSRAAALAPVVVKAQLPVQPEIKAPPREAKADIEVQKLTAELRQLTADSKQLATRVASLERHLDDVTGSIERRAVAPAPLPTPAPAVSVPAPTPPMISASSMLPKFAAIALPPNEAPRIIEPLAMPAVQNTVGAWSDPSKTKAEIKPKAKVNPQPKPVASTTRTAPMPRARSIRTALAAAPSRRPIAAPGPELGVDIGGAMTVGRLSEQWTEVKANFGPTLASLYPIVGRDHHFGHLPYRLLVGPVTSMSEAVRLCANLVPGGLNCRPARFEGQQLAQH